MRVEKENKDTIIKREEKEAHNIKEWKLKKITI